MKPVFKSIYYFENDTHSIIEIKRTDLDEDAEISDIYKWLFIDKNSQNIEQLWFSAMESMGKIEERYFEQGYISFTVAEGTFYEKYSSTQHQLTNKSKEKVPAALVGAIEKFLSA